MLGDSVSVSGTLQSAYTVSSVQGQLQGASAQNLTLNGTNYTGTLDASSVAVGPMTLTVAATDALAGVGSASVSLIHDHPPTISVATQSGFVARPSLHLQATCNDPDMYGCATLSVAVGGAVVASANGSTLDTMVSLSQYDGKAVTLTFTATDTQGMSASVSRSGNVDTALDLPIVAQGDRPILSFDATRILFATDVSLVIRPRAGGTDTVAGTGTFSSAYLTSHGAIWPGGEWRDGVALTNAATGDLVANGDYAGWTTINDTTIVGNVAAYWRDVATDTTTQIASGGYQTYGPSVASNGDMVFTWIAPSSQYQRVYRYRGGVSTEIPGSCVRCDGALTDGVNVVYHQHLLGGGRGETYLYDGTTETVLDNAANGRGRRAVASIGLHRADGLDGVHDPLQRDDRHRVHAHPHGDRCSG